MVLSAEKNADRQRSLESRFRLGSIRVGKLIIQGRADVVAWRRKEPEVKSEFLFPLIVQVVFRHGLDADRNRHIGEEVGELNAGRPPRMDVELNRIERIVCD
jgi:hypothetical protein